MVSVRASNTAWLVPGCRLDRYDLLLQVAEGGMGLLWLARQHGKHGFDKIVAIKTILPKLASDSGFQRMFLDEARVASRIEHPNVAQVLDLGEERGVLFLAMEWIDGESLLDVGIAVEGEVNPRIPVGILARVMVDACAGLHAAHELADDDGLALGVVHRDVSPHNLFIGFRGTTKVIDFGIAKVRNRMAQDTSVGLLKGKIAYMAPEQAMGSLVDRRTDVWSAGASMYRFLAGRAPYGASEPVAVLHRIVEGRPLTPLPTTVPEPIRVVVERALELDPGKRFETANALGAALETAMRAAEICTTREDVAAFMAEHRGEGHALRIREIEHAVRESRARVRVGATGADSASGMAFPIGPKELGSESQALSSVSWDEPLEPEIRSAPPLRPSRLPTALIAASPPFARKADSASRPSGRPTAILPAVTPSIGAGELPRTPSQGVIDSARPSGQSHGTAVAARASLLVAPRVQRWAASPLRRWVAGTGLLALALAGGFAWRSASPSPAIAAGDVATGPKHGPAAPEIAIGAASSPEPAGQVIVPTLDLHPPSPASASPKYERAPATLPVEPSPERVSTGDLLERARHARRAGRIDEAAALFAAAVEKAPTDSEALTGLAEVDEAQGATAKAIVTYRRALAANPKYLPARLGLAGALWTSGRRDEAEIAYRGIVDDAPANLCPDIARERAAGTARNEKALK